MIGIGMKTMMGAAGASVPSSNGWDISNATYDSIFLDLSGDDDTLWGLFFNPNGTKLFVTTNSTYIRQYSLSIEWDITTAVFDYTSFYYGDNTAGIFFHPDGIKIYRGWLDSSDISQHSLPTAWDIEISNFENSWSSLSVGYDIFFNNLGTKIYILDNLSIIRQYSLSTAWDISTASYDSISLDISSQGGIPRGIFFKPDGTKLYVASGTSIFQYSLSTAWDISTTSYDSIFLVLFFSSRGIFFKPDGTKIYITANDKSIYQYSL